MAEKVNKILKCIPVIMIICGIVMIAVILTFDIRKDNLPLREAAVFDKNGAEGVYSSVEIDFLEPILTKRNPASGEVYNTYYLFGNSKTKEFGIACMDYIPADLFENAETVWLYGDTSAMSEMLRSDIVYQAENDALYMLNKDIHYAEETFEAFSEKIGKIDRDSDFGKVFMFASFEPEKEETLPFRLVNLLGWIAAGVLCLSIIFSFTIGVFFGKR